MIALITIDEPVGIYYGGTIAAPVVADIFSNILPYLDVVTEWILPRRIEFLRDGREGTEQIQMF